MHHSAELRSTFCSLRLALRTSRVMQVMVMTGSGSRGDDAGGQLTKQRMTMSDIEGDLDAAART